MDSVYSNRHLTRQKRVLTSRGKDDAGGSQRKIKNPYFLNSKLSKFRFEKVLRLFADDVTATTTAKRARVDVRSVNEIFRMLRERIEEELSPEGSWLSFNLAGYPLQNWEWIEECLHESCCIEMALREVERKPPEDFNPDQHSLFGNPTTDNMLQIAAHWRKVAGKAPDSVFQGKAKELFERESKERHELRVKEFKLRIVGKLWKIRVFQRKLPEKHLHPHLSEMYVREICRLKHIRDYLNANGLDSIDFDVRSRVVLDMFSDESISRSRRVQSNGLFYQELRRLLLERPLGVSFERIDDNFA